MVPITSYFCFNFHFSNVLTYGNNDFSCRDISKFAMHFIVEEIDEDTSMEELQKMMLVALVYRILVCFYEVSSTLITSYLASPTTAGGGGVYPVTMIKCRFNAD